MTYDFLKLYFYITLPKLDHFFLEKRKPKISGFKNAMEKGIRNYFTFVIGKLVSKIFGTIVLKPLKLPKDSSSLG